VSGEHTSHRSAGQDVLQLLRVGGPPEGLVLGDHPLGEEHGQALVEGLHSELRLTDLHRRVDLVDLVLADEVPDGRVGDHDLQGKAPPPSRLLEQGLAQHPFDDEGQLGADLGLLEGREHVQDPVDGLHAAVGVQGPEADVAGLGDHQRRLDGFEISHLAHQHHVRILAEDVLQRGLEAAGVRPHLALVDEAVLVRVEVLDRVLDRHDVLVTIGVDLVDDAGEGGALPRAGGAGDQHQATRLLGELGHHRRQAQLLEGEDLEGDGPEGPGHRAPLHVEVGPEARERLHPEGEVELVILLELGLLRIGQDRVADLLRLHR
jgi:hypothetical protein